MNGTSTLWTVDRDSILVGGVFIASVAGVCIVSKDPALLITDLTAPTSTIIEDQFLLILRCSSSTNGLASSFENLKIPISAGSQIYLAVSTTGTAVLLLDEPVSFS
jgi:hypothetical protein